MAAIIRTETQNTPAQEIHPRLIALSEVMSRTGMGRTWIYNSLRDGKFPAQVKLGKRALWVESEINEWIDSQIANRNQN